MKTNDIRQRFLTYFEEKGHTVVSSSPLVPHNDPTLLFTNAGMVQFKDVFLGNERRPYQRAVTSQRCVRAGGKHNDLENVGYTARHHTFFEMLGNFSFGDYFKRDAIEYAWELLTEVFGLPAEKLWVTVYENDDDAARIWLNDIGVPEARFRRIGAKDNFWAMGDTGPCGPCSEIFYDHGPNVFGGPPGTKDEGGDRFVEIWNLVFMQFNRAANGVDTALPKPSVDTGMGLERIAAVLQGVHSNYEIDLFEALLESVANLLNVEDHHHHSLQVIADHIRSTAFLISDGVMPSNEGRGYVLRRIIRRAIRHGYQLGHRDPFLHRLISPLIAQMGDASTELVAAQTMVERALVQEEERFAETLEQGLRILDQEMAALSGAVIPGEVVFRLYDTFGFPVDLTADVAREHSLTIDEAGFESAMNAQRERARAASRFQMGEVTSVNVADTTFLGYTSMEGAGEVVSIVHDQAEADVLETGARGIVVLDQTPFYAESGGQVGDRGQLRVGDALFEVTDARYVSGRVVAHIGQVVSGSISIGDNVSAQVGFDSRATTANNHSATHLLHAALREVLGDHVQQRGSLVDPDRLRFDFGHQQALSEEELDRVEDLVNRQVRANHKVVTEVMSIDKARARGAVALFGEKYDDEVRVVEMGGYSMELCGGTHVTRTGDIGNVRLVSEAGIASGVRRIEALTGEAARLHTARNEGVLRRLGVQFRTGTDELEDKASQLQHRVKKLERRVEQLQAQAAGGSERAMMEIDGVRVITARHDDLEPRSMRAALDHLRSEVGTGVVVIGGVREGKVTLLAGVTADQVGRLHAGELIRYLAPMVGGTGGGKADMAQGGGSNAARLDEALAAVSDWVKGR